MKSIDTIKQGSPQDGSRHMHLLCHCGCSVVIVRFTSGIVGVERMSILPLKTVEEWGTNARASKSWSCA